MSGSAVVLVLAISTTLLIHKLKAERNKEEAKAKIFQEKSWAVVTAIGMCQRAYI